MSSFTRLSLEEQARYLEYRAAIWNAVYLHVEAVGAFALTEILTRQISQYQDRPNVLEMDHWIRAMLTGRLIERQAAALRRAVEARMASHKAVSKVKNARQQLDFLEQKETNG
jgi:hypothetical protein